MVDYLVVIDDLKDILTVVPFTLGTALIILVLGMILGFIIALIRAYDIPVARSIVMIFMYYTRGIPLIIHLYITYYFFPLVLADVMGNAAAGDIPVNPLLVMIVAYSLYNSVGQAENFKGVLGSIEKSQWDAAFSVGMSFSQTWIKVIIPQGTAVALPVIFNNYLGIIKGLSLAFTIGVVDILARAKLCSALNFSYLEAYMAAALVYWGLCVVFNQFFKRVEDRFRRWSKQTGSPISNRPAI
jgi:His/Glu/Gln/Arg/opine family amino acid ABC transporter permease subunit